MKHLIVVAVCLAAASAINLTCSPPDEYQRVIQTKRSGTNDDDMVEIRCPPKYAMLACECQSFPDDPAGCDGEVIAEDKDGFKCQAWNSAVGKGVVAVATCAKVMSFCQTEYLNENSDLRCAADFRPLSCAMHASWYHKIVEAGKRPYGMRDGGGCKLTTGCELGVKGCKLAAMCIRAGDFITS